MPIFDIFLRPFRKKTINELFSDVENAFNQLLKIYSEQGFSEDDINEIKSFVAEKLRILVSYKERYPNVNILSFRRWIDITLAELIDFEEAFEAIEDKRKSKACLSGVNNILDALNAIEEVVPAVRRAA